MNEIMQWVLIVVAISIPPLIAACFNYALNKKKVKAETESIELKNKITKGITYKQLETDNKHKNIKSKIDIFQKIIALEEEIKNKGQKTISDQKKLESLEMIKKEFKESFLEKINEINEPKLVEQKKEKLETKKSGTKKKTRKNKKK